MRVAKKPNLKIDKPDATFFRAAALEVKKRIRKRTETEGLDYEGKDFIPYTERYKKYREEKGRSTRPNLSFSGKLMTVMSTYAKDGKGFVALSGFYSKIASGNESNGRVFFALSSSDRDNVIKKVSAWMKKKNGLK